MKGLLKALFIREKSQITSQQKKVEKFSMQYEKLFEVLYLLLRASLGFHLKMKIFLGFKNIRAIFPLFIVSISKNPLIFIFFF